jgi:hypothetical protein
MNDGRPHFGEPNLDALIRRVVESGKLRGSTEFESADTADPRSAGDQRRKTRIRLRQSSHLFGSPEASGRAFLQARCGRYRNRAPLGRGEGRHIAERGAAYFRTLDLLISALTKIRVARPETVLLLAGGGPEKAILKAKISQGRLGKAVRFVGRVPHGEVRRYCDLVDYFVYPRSRMRLTDLVTPLKPLEAMAERRIVVASEVGGHRELIRDSETGFLFSPDDPSCIADGVIEVLSAKDQRKHIRDAARHYIETSRTWPICASVYRDAYDVALRLRA